ncbi:VTT domain-containing protein [Paucilactobacillus suebicus]|nr:VTT domain-containing protein [Paucilactobacillus suebicus]
MITSLMTSILNISHLLPQVIAQFGWLTYIGLFGIIFIETGLVLFPFLPGDSILFLCGSIAALSNHPLNHIILIIVLSIAAILGDFVNFEIGQHLGKHLTGSNKWSKWIKPKYVKDAQSFFNRHGSSAIFLGRFVPIIRTFIPFTAGASKMQYRKFAIFNILGAFSWVAVAVLAGFLFGNVSIVKAHFELIMVAIIIISLAPAVLMSVIQNKRNVGL